MYDRLGLAYKSLEYKLCFTNNSLLGVGLPVHWRRPTKYVFRGIALWSEYWSPTVVQELPKYLMKSREKREKLLKFANIRFGE